MALTPKSYILAIEAAIAGGSISLFRGDRELAGWTGPTAVSKAEDLLFNVDQLLREQGVSKHELSMVAVSAGPGSFTGIRIGLATALGLKSGLGIPMASESALKAMVYGSKKEGKVVAAVPSGRNAVCMQTFTVAGLAILGIDEAHTVHEGEFFAAEFQDAHILVHNALFERVTNKQFIDCGTNIARYIAAICGQEPDNITPPLFISKNF